MPRGVPVGAMCVQRFDDSLNSAIHTTYRISLRSSSMPEPRDPLLKVLKGPIQAENCNCKRGVSEGPQAGELAEETRGAHEQGSGGSLAVAHLAQGQLQPRRHHPPQRTLSRSVGGRRPCSGGFSTTMGHTQRSLRIKTPHTARIYK